MNLLVCGHGAFAARGLPELLAAKGHRATCFTRGPLARSGQIVSGPVEEIDRNPHLDVPFDAVINYLLLKDRPIAENLAYLGALLALCAKTGSRRLIHLSSVTVYRSGTATVRADSPIEDDPQRRGPYGSLKIATDRYLIDNAPRTLAIFLARPGFILGEGLVDPIVGMAFRTPWSRLLLIGDPGNAVPVTERRVVNDVIAKLVTLGPLLPVEPILICDGASPTRRQYLEHLCARAGFGSGVLAAPVLLWQLAALGGDVAARILGMNVRPRRAIFAACRRQRYDPASSQERLGIDFGVDWRAGVLAALDGQRPNYELPEALPAVPRTTDIGAVGFIGFGRIVRDRHLPALARLGFDGEIHPYDLPGAGVSAGRTVHDIRSRALSPADLYVVASPGPVHAQAIPLLEKIAAPVLVEKPLACDARQLEAWIAFARRHARLVVVCHNYRFKPNVTAMLDHLRRHNPGRLLHVSVHFQSPPVANDGASWLRKERRARTLLLDYSLHFLDLACMFHGGEWDVRQVRHEENGAGETGLIEGSIACSDYSVAFLLRQGAIPRCCRLTFVFQNYATTLGFFPETFVPYMTHLAPPLYGAERKSLQRATLRRVADRLARRVPDESHCIAYLAATSSLPSVAAALSPSKLRFFYRVVFELADAVYGRGAVENVAGVDRRVGTA